MTKEEILNGMSEEEFYNLYPTEEAYFMAKGGSLSGAPHNGQPTADEFFSYGAPALGHMNIPMSNPTYLAHGGMYHSDGPFYHAQPGMIINPPKAAPVAAPDADAFMTQYDKTNPAVSGFNDPPKSIINTPKFNTRSQYDKFKGNPNFAKYSDADMQGLGFDVPAEPKANLNQKPQRPYIPAGQDSSGTGLFTNPQGQQFTFSKGEYNPYSPPPTPPPIVAKQRYGGYMDMGGYNSPTNYGSFSVPMDEGGMPMAQPGVQVNPEMKAFLEQRNQSNINNTPSRTKNYEAEGTDLSRLYPNKNNFDLRVEGQRFPTDSVVNIPNNPQLQAAYRNGKFTIAGSTQAGIKQAAAINAGNLKQGKDKMVYADYSNLYKQEYGGILDASNNQDYPVMDEGGRSNLMKIIKAAGKKMKKEYAAGGDTTMQGGNQDYIANIKGTYDNFLKQNVYNSLVDQEQQDLSKAFMEKGGQPSFFQMLAENYAPRERASGFNYFPANRNRGYELSNQDYSKLSQLGNDAKLSGLGVNYGLLARGLGKFGRRMFGPKEIYFDIMHNKPTIQTKPYQQASATTTAPAETDRHVIRDPNREMNLGPAIQPKANPNISWNTTFGYGGYYQQGGNPSAMSNNWSFAGASAPQFTTPQSVGIQAPAPITMQDSGAPLVSGDTMLNKDTSRVALKRDNSAFLNAVGQYAVPGINKLAGMIEAPGQQKRQKQAMLNAMTPGSDTGPFAVKPANAMNRGDYDPNSGMFRPDDMVPVQFPGGMYNDYGRGMAFGGTYEEGEEYELSQEEIDELRNQGYELEELD